MAILPDTNGLDDEPIEAEGIHQIASLQRLPREPAHGPSARHGTDEDLWIETVFNHADAIAEQCAAREGTARIHGENA